MRRGVAPIIALVLAATIGLGSAAAAPKGEAFTITCGGQTFTIVTPTTTHDNEDVTTFTPAFVVDSHQVLVPFAFSFTLSENGQVIDSQTVTKGQGKMTGLQDRLTTCTFSETMGDFTFQGTATVFMPGRP